MAQSLLQGFPEAAPPRPTGELIYADVAVTATAKEFAGIYRNKHYHEPDFTLVLDRAQDAGVKKVMLTGMSSADISFDADIARSRPSQCSITVGIHPYHAAEPYENDSDGSDYLAALAKTINGLRSSDPGMISAFGELGLDYHHLDHASKETQLQCFRDQLGLFVKEKWHLPLFLHCRAAFDDFVTTMEPFLSQLPKEGLIHSFVGSKAQMEKLVYMGFHISVNGFSFKDRESLEMVAAIPLDKLQLETDAPWGNIQTSSEVAKRYLVNTPTLSASKKKDKFQMGSMVKERNESCAISRVAFVVAGLKGIGVEEVTQAAWKNSMKMFWGPE